MMPMALAAVTVTVTVVDRNRPDLPVLLSHVQVLVVAGCAGRGDWVVEAVGDDVEADGDIAPFDQFRDRVGHAGPSAATVDAVMATPASDARAIAGRVRLRFIGSPFHG